MALIKCPECGKEISDKSDKCINCGCPVNIEETKKYSLYIVGYRDTDTHAVAILYELLNIEMETGFTIIANLPYKLKESIDIAHIKNIAFTLEQKEVIVKVLDNFNNEYSFEDGMNFSSKLNNVKCPKCGSTSITTGARGVNFTWGLIGASKTVNRCAKCGCSWKPNN